MGEYHKLSTQEGSFSIYIEYPDVTMAPVVVVLQEIFGINNDLRASCRELANEGFIAVCPDLFWRQEPELDLNEWSEADWKKGLALYGSYDFDAGVRDIAATIEAARSLDGTNGKVGVMGYCLGGLMTFLTTARTDVDAGAEYYGGGTERYLAEAQAMTAPLIMHLGEKDEFIDPEAQRQIADRFQGSPRVTIYSYPGCSHAFARHTGTHYEAHAAKLANQRTYEFFRQHLA